MTWRIGGSALECADKAPGRGSALDPAAGTASYGPATRVGVVIRIVRIIARGEGRWSAGSRFPAVILCIPPLLLSCLAAVESPAFWGLTDKA